MSFLIMFDSGSRSEFFSVQAEMQKQGIHYWVPRRGTSIIFTWNEPVPPPFITERFGSEKEWKMIGQCPNLPEVGEIDGAHDDHEDRKTLGLVSKV